MNYFIIGFIIGIVIGFMASCITVVSSKDSRRDE